MYAIIENGGKQYKVTEGEKIKLEKMVRLEAVPIRTLKTRIHCHLELFQPK